jgi:uncharacterized protein YggE
MTEQDCHEQPDLIEVRAEHEEDEAADKVDLYVDVEGSSLFTGRAALSKAREVHALVESLAQVGIAEDQIFVERISATTTSGIFSKSSSAHYSLRVRCRNLEKLGDVLGAITSQKNVTMGRTEWGFDESPAASARRLARCAAIAKQKAQAVAEALGVRLGAPHRTSEVVPASEEPQPHPFTGAPVLMSVARASMSQEDLGLAVTHHRKVTTRLSAAFRIETGPAATR